MNGETVRRDPAMPPEFLLLRLEQGRMLLAEGVVCEAWHPPEEEAAVPAEPGGALLAFPGGN